MTASSGFEAPLAAALKAVHAQPTPDIAAFWAAWAAEGGDLLPDLAAWRRACAEPGAELDLMDRIHGMLTGASGAALARSLREPARRLTKAMMLAAVAQHVAALGQAVGSAGAGDLLVQVQDTLTADLLAAVYHGCGLRMQRGEDGKQWAVNVRRDSAAAVYGDDDAAYAAWCADLLAWSDMARSAADILKDQTIRPDRLAGGAPLAPWVVKRSLDRVQREQGVRPIVSIQRGSQSSLARSAATRQRLQTELGVLSYEHDANAPAWPAGHVLAQLQSTVQRFVDGFFNGLDGGLPAPLPAVAAGSAKQVFLSYAHLDGDPWHQRVALHLRGLPAVSMVQPWSDKQINTGDDWIERIRAALDGSRCAVLVLTPGFLASDFIKRHEIPALLERRASEGMALLPVLASQCVWPSHPWLERLQAQCAGRPLDDCEDAEINAQLSALATQIHDLLSPP